MTDPVIAALLELAKAAHRARLAAERRRAKMRVVAKEEDRAA